MRRNNSYVLEHIIDSWEKLIEKLFHDRNDVLQQVANCVDNWAQWIAGCLSRNSVCLKFHFKLFTFSTIKYWTALTSMHPRKAHTTKVRRDAILARKRWVFRNWIKQVLMYCHFNFLIPFYIGQMFTKSIVFRHT